AAAAHSVTVANLAPVVTAPAAQSSGEGQSKSFGLGSFGDAGANDAPWHVAVNWGDSPTPTTFTTSSQGSLGSQPHTYADNGTYTVYGRVFDKDGGYTDYTTSVTVNNVAPVVTLAGPNSGLRGQTLSCTASFTDPGVNDGPWTVTVSWGDGSPDT